MLSDPRHRIAHVLRPFRAGRFALLAVALVAALTSSAQAGASDGTRVASVETELAQAAPDVPKPATERAGTPPSSPTAISAISPRVLYRALIEREVRNTRLPADVAEAVMGVESGYDPSRVGADGEIGLMQVMPSTARMLGYNGTMADFAVPETNIKYGVNYLAQAWIKAGGDLCTALMKYRAGHGETRFSQLSVDYCMRARARLAAKGYSITGTVPVATFGLGRSLGGRAGAGCRRGCIGIGGTGRVDFTALNSRLAQVAIQINSPRLPGK